MGASPGHHLPTLHRRVGIVLKQNNQNFSESKQIYWNIKYSKTNWIFEANNLNIQLVHRHFSS